MTPRLILTLLAALLLTTPAAAQSAKRPNIILILADDLGFSDIGCYGSEIASPNLDKLAAKGIRFTQFYNTGRCCPTRASLLTGLYSHQAGVGHMVQDLGKPAYQGRLNQRCVTIAELLKALGYRTYMIGKWHVCRLDSDRGNWPLQRGFDRFFGLIGSVRSYFDPPTLTRDNMPIQADKNFYLTDAITDNAIDCLKEAARRPEPFFMYVAHTAPHWPLHALPEDIVKYRRTYLGGWDALREARYKRQLDMKLIDPRWKLAPRDPAVPAWDQAANHGWEDYRMAVYAAQIDRLDQGIGRLMDALDESGRRDDTLVLFLSDNGGNSEEIAPDWSPRLFPLKTRWPGDQGRQPARQQSWPRRCFSEQWPTVGPRQQHAVSPVQIVGTSRRRRHAADRSLAQGDWQGVAHRPARTRHRFDGDLPRSCWNAISGQVPGAHAAADGGQEPAADHQGKNTYAARRAILGA